MKSETGASLTKIAAIINFVIAGIVLFVALVISLFINYIRKLPNAEVSHPFLPIAIFILGILISLVIILIGCILLISSRKMLNAKTARNGAIWAIIIGVIEIGNIIGILALIGGIIGLTDANK